MRCVAINMLAVTGSVKGSKLVIEGISNWSYLMKINGTKDLIKVGLNVYGEDFYNTSWSLK